MDTPPLTQPFPSCIVHETKQKQTKSSTYLKILLNVVSSSRSGYKFIVHIGPHKTRC